MQKQTRVNGWAKEVDGLEAFFASLGRLLVKFHQDLDRSEVPSALTEVAVRRKAKVSPAVRHGRRLQGRYMGLIRMLPAPKKAQVKKLRSTKGIVAAIKLATTMRAARERGPEK